ncbi:LLM class flavin-dependent oxidoreductase [Amycolatopsis regifaucium]|uniref:Monooxygenase n=1 Tax=Amycolatopsis regifaucium TaxID=546365 RepID=A0A154MNA9_9PSEU|nr:LLM class flavin-dependent oxidoreductase [Amycolatopsis regifaucium]KZB84909.1 monooxygenase [Amycolatopsis regifaucium]OKA03927.1 monooxygenase [Amycolatopsis regifaucium]SFI00445.1 luciferase family oxidoreductase, group 1 [Amycolatopsis regifaucium]
MGILLSALELAVVEDGRAATEVLSSMAAVAGKLEELGYHRLWIAEHHGSPAIATASPPVLAAHLAATTSVIRIGSGGVLAPNHAPLAIAEQFATLSALHPGRIDLGVGRGPGTFDEKIIRALRRGAEPATDDEYRADVAELLRHLAGETGIRVLPGAVPTPEPWLLCSSTAGALLAAELGLPIAAAHHIRPQHTAEVLQTYRENFKPSRWREKPYVILAVETICADTDAEAAYIAGPCTVIKSYLLKGEGGDLAFPTLEQAAAHEFVPETAETIAQFTAAQAHGGPEKVARSLKNLAAATGADELMLTTPVYDAGARARSYELVAKYCI